MAAPKGNEYYLLRATSGAPKKLNAKKILEEFNKWIFWIKDNPLKEEIAFHSNGKITKTTISKTRAPTLESLSHWLGISIRTWRNYRNDKDLFPLWDCPF